MKARALGWLKALGPGLITGAADDDPSGISTYSVAGAVTGYSMLWIALITTPMMAVIQGMCARIALVSGEGLAALMRKRLPLWAAYGLGLIVVVANTFNAGADIAGMAASAHLVAGLPVVAWVAFFGVVLVIMQVYFSYRTLAKVLKWLALTLFAYIITAFVVHPPWAHVFLSLIVPQVHLNAVWLSTAVGVMGTTITPYLFFWQASLEIEEEKAAGKATIKARRGSDPQEIKAMHADVNTGMIFSNVVAMFIIVTTAATLGAHGNHQIGTASQAAEALRPLAGNFAYLLFALGMVGTGLLAVPALTGSSAYVSAELFKFREGLDEKPRKARKFYAVLVAGVVAGAIMAGIGIDPIAALFWSAVLNGVAAVPLIAVIVWLASNHALMGRWRSSLIARWWGWATVALMGATAVAMFYFMAKGSS
ncbi:MAG TPA: Nramp family divalent metal transporter [Verrucomicrobiae bacterium]|nr:Nramp family divalent metal transporter [Verrucomicrobiae bacterium]